MSETVRCHMGDDYYEGPYFFEGKKGDYSVPRELFDKWSAAKEAWKSTQDEISDFVRKNPPPPREPGALSKALMDLYSDQIAASLRPLPEWIKNAGH